MLERFPLLTDHDERRRYPHWPVSVPWDLIAPHEAQAMRNHGNQTLRRLAQRGGLDPVEMYAVLTDQYLDHNFLAAHPDPDEVMKKIMRLGGLHVHD